MQGTPQQSVDPQAEALQMQIDVGNEQELKNTQKENKALEGMVKDFYAKPLLEAKALTPDEIKGASASALKLAHDVMKTLMSQGIGSNSKTNAPERNPPGQGSPKQGQIPKFNPKTGEVEYS